MFEGVVEISSKDIDHFFPEKLTNVVYNIGSWVGKSDGHREADDPVFDLGISAIKIETSFLNKHWEAIVSFKGFVETFEEGLCFFSIENGLDVW